MIKNVIFDLGNVLINFDFNRFFAVCGYAPDERDVDEALPILMKFDAGKMSRNEFYLQMREFFDFTLSQDEFEAAWCDNFWENKEMIALARSLSKKFNVFILSNTDEIHFPYIWQQFPSLHFFAQNLMLSYQLKAVKPEKIIFEKALRKFDLVAEECLFIDDNQRNVQAALDLRMKAVWHRNNQETGEKIFKSLTSKCRKQQFDHE